MAIVNYGKKGGAHVSFHLISILLAINLVSFIGLISKLFFDVYTMSLITMMLSYSVSLSINYLIFLYKSRYKGVISYFEGQKQRRFFGAYKSLIFIMVTFIFFVMVVFL